MIHSAARKDRSPNRAQQAALVDLEQHAHPVQLRRRRRVPP